MRAPADEVLGRDVELRLARRVEIDDAPCSIEPEVDVWQRAQERLELAPCIAQRGDVLDLGEDHVIHDPARPGQIARPVRRAATAAEGDGRGFADLTEGSLGRCSLRCIDEQRSDQALVARTEPSGERRVRRDDAPFAIGHAHRDARDQERLFTRERCCRSTIENRSFPHRSPCSTPLDE